MTVELSLVVPCLNEEDNVTLLATRFFEAANLHGVAAEVVFVDDGSTDQTLLRIRNLESKTPARVKVISNSSNVGIAESWSVGIEKAVGEFVCLIDADLQNPPEEVLRMLRIIRETKCDLVRGIRCSSNSDKSARFVMSRILNWLLNCLFGMKSRDNKSGFILTKRDLAKRILQDRQRYRFFQTFLGVSAESLEARAVEVETPFYARHSGDSFLDHQSLFVAFKVLCDFPQALWMYRFRKSQRRQ
jgi:phenylacetate-CoA ligase